IKGQPVIEIYESFDGSYWFVTEKAWRQDSVIGGKVYKNDQILFGYVRLSVCPECAEFGYFSEGELKRLGPRIWKVHRQDWAVCPLVEVAEPADEQQGGEPGSDCPPSPSYSNTCKEVDEKMETDTQQRVDSYIALFDGISEKVNSDAVAIAILQEISKDRRSGEIRTERATQGTGPATEKQKQFMKKLNIRFPATVTKHEASALIDEELAKNGE
ncbi:MAG: hypothetical protein JW741_11065, partial [Sedimentisphaerales bacterium]|nr:hypothetical protein [Sedimentisphaerales bacterium]